VETTLTEYVNLKVHNLSCSWTARSGRTVHARICTGLCTPILLGLPWLIHNQIVIDHAACTVVEKSCGFDLFNPRPPEPPTPPKPRLRETVAKDIKANLEELKRVCAERLQAVEGTFEEVRKPNIMAAVKEHVEVLAAHPGVLPIISKWTTLGSSPNQLSTGSCRKSWKSLHRYSSQSRSTPHYFQMDDFGEFTQPALNGFMQEILEEFA
jgi:hypothetical protein